MRQLHILTATTLLACGAVSCGEDDASDACVEEDADGNVTIVCTARWTETVSIEGVLTITDGGELILDGATIEFDSAVEDSDTFRMQGSAKLIGRGARLASSSGKQWNLQAHDASSIDLEDTVATEHSGLRLFEGSTLSARGGDIEEVQVHDDVAVTLASTSAYVVLFFVEGVTASFDQGELEVGDGVSRQLTVPTSLSTTGEVVLEDAAIDGWQIDLEQTSSVSVTDAADVVLAVHLVDGAFVQAAGQLVTTDVPASGALDFGAEGPKFSFDNSAISSLNFYAEGATSLDFDDVVVTEPNAGGTSEVTFSDASSLYANLAQTYASATMTLDGTTLLEEDVAEGGSFPSFTAEDASLIRILDVVATPHTRVYSVGAGRVEIEGGSGWTAEMFEAIEPEGDGGIYLDGTKVAP